MRSMTPHTILKVVFWIVALALIGCSSRAKDYLEVSSDQLEKQGASLDGRELVVSGACVRMYQHGLALVSCEAFGTSIALDFDPQFSPSEVGSMGSEAHRYLMSRKSPMPVEVCGVYTHRESTHERWMVVDGMRASASGTPGIGSCPSPE